MRKINLGAPTYSLSASPRVIDIDTTGVVSQLATAMPGTLTYSKLSGSADLSVNGATGAVSLASGLDPGGSVSAVFRVTNGTATSRTLALTLTATPAPANLTVPTITGTSQVGQTLTAHHGTYSGEPTSYALQWQADGEDIALATEMTFEATVLELGMVITVVEIATNGGGDSDPAESAPTAAVVAA